MLSKFQSFLFLAVALLLASCAVIEEKQPDSKTILEADTYSAWRLTGNEKATVASNRAVTLLLAQADELISIENYEQASDKLERLVRIEPQFAQAWSRLAWIALKNGDAGRSQQLAQRSISYSRGNTGLKILNWRFIEKTGEMLNDVAVVQQAQQMITKLGND